MTKATFHLSNNQHIQVDIDRDLNGAYTWIHEKLTSRNWFRIENTFFHPGSIAAVTVDEFDELCVIPPPEAAVELDETATLEAGDGVEPELVGLNAEGC